VNSEIQNNRGDKGIEQAYAITVYTLSRQMKQLVVLLILFE